MCNSSYHYWPEITNTHTKNEGAKEYHIAAEMAKRMLVEGIYVVGFSFPVVPKGQARIRTQISAAHSKAQLDKAIDAFIRIGKDMGVIA